MAPLLWHSESQPACLSLCLILQQDGFVVDEADEEGEEGEGEEGVKKKKRRRKRVHKELQLDEEDYEMLEENQVKVSEPLYAKVT